MLGMIWERGIYVSSACSEVPQNSSGGSSVLSLPAEGMTDMLQKSISRQSRSVVGRDASHTHTHTHAPHGLASPSQSNSLLANSEAADGGCLSVQSQGLLLARSFPSNWLGPAGGCQPPRCWEHGGVCVCCVLPVRGISFPSCYGKKPPKLFGLLACYLTGFRGSTLLLVYI